MRGSALITGATGFVGSHLVERLAAGGWHCRALVRPTSDTATLERFGVERAAGSLEDADSLRRAMGGVDVVFHLAAVTTAPDQAGYFRANAEGTQRVVDALLAAEPRPRRLVYLSSYAACGPARGSAPRRADEPPEPLTAYGRSKLAGEAPVRDLARHGVDAVILRAPAVYGPGDRAFLPYFRLVNRRLAPSPSGPERRVHLIHVEDLARALARAAEVAPGTYPVADPVEHRWSAVVEQISRALGRRPVTVPLPPALVRLAGAAAERMGDLLGGAGVFNREKAEELLAPAWVCDLAGSAALLPPSEATPLERGIERTAQWYRTNGWL
ncbi:MAG: NAD-dependent epimerase/dehydratase family protein [Gemmatimonadetes bacterium]|nr:NAD-dependent epimerase/dehydratase family protein [Gemmatimonadota bacterium]